FDEHFGLARPGRRVWEQLEQQWVITSHSVVQLPEHLPKNGPLGFSNMMSQNRRLYSKCSLALLLRVACFASPEARSKSAGERWRYANLAAKVMRGNLSSAMS